MRRLAGIAAVAALVLVLAGCSVGGSSDSAGSVAVPAPAGVDGGAAPDAGGRSELAVEGRDVIITGYLDLVAGDPLVAAAKARGIVEGAGGRLDAYSETPATDAQRASAQVTARIPVDRLDDTLDDLRGLGEVRSLSTSTSDVTQQSTDLDARIASLTASVDRLRGLLSTATSTADLISIETALSTREADLESLRAQRDALSDQIDYATVSITVSAPGAAGPATPTDFWGGVVAGFNTLVAALGTALVGLGAALPWLAFLALVGAVVLAIVRAVSVARRRRRTTTPTPELPGDPSN